MISSVKSFTLANNKVIPIKIEVDISNGLFDFSIIGLPHKIVLESKRKIILAIKNSGYRFPMKRITVNLSPIDIPKESSGIELAIAVAILKASGEIKTSINNIYIWGEIDMKGYIKMPRGIIPILNFLSKNNSIAILPTITLKGMSVKDGNILLYKEFKEVIQSLNQNIVLKTNDNSIKQININLDNSIDNGKRVGEIMIPDNSITQSIAIALAGRHNLLVIGPPGIGKTFICDQIEKIKIPLDKNEILEVSAIYDMAGLLNNNLISELQVRPVQRNITYAGLFGGGKPFKIGEAELSHRGVLFLDEFNSFKHEVFEDLKTIMDNRAVILSRGGYKYSYKSVTTIVAVMNPCKCGYFRVKHKICKCNENDIRRYWFRIPGAVFDRFAIGLGIQDMNDYRKTNNSDTISLEKLRNKIATARGNLEIIPSELTIDFSRQATALLNRATDAFNFSIRNRVNTIKVARSIAYLDNREKIKEDDVQEALNMRLRLPNDRISL
jgi:magnesium chelatase family protein